MESLYLTYDLGTTALKTALVSHDGRLLGISTEEYAFDSPQPGWAEMPAERYWDAVVAGTRAALAKASADPSAVAAVGLSSQGQTFVSLDSDGAPLHPFVVWLDTRAQGITEEWSAGWLSAEDFHKQTGYGWIPAQLSVFSIAWLCRHLPQACRAWKFLCLPDYLVYRLTGETVTDAITARMTGLFDMRSGTWAPVMLRAAGISAEQLPVILPPGRIGGRLTPAVAAELGLPPGTPVCMGANDQLAGAIGAGNVASGVITETTGTALALVATTDAPVWRADVVCGPHASPPKWYAMTFANASAIVLTWLRDLCAPGADYEAFLAGVEHVPPGSDGLCVLPHFAGTREAPAGRGAFLGLSLSHTRAHLARAVMEACACLLDECLDPLRANGVAVTIVRSLGGAARSDVWLQMKADVLGLPVDRPACTDAASLGAAMLAAVGTGQFADLPSAVRAWYRSDRVFSPDPARHAAYRDVSARYRRYSKLILAAAGKEFR